MSDEVKTLTPHLQKVTDIHLKSSKDRELEENGNIKILFLLGALALFVLFVSTLNFLNLQYVVFLRRQKAISVYNYAGAGFRNHLANQLLESFIYSLLVNYFQEFLSLNGYINTSIFYWGNPLIPAAN